MGLIERERDRVRGELDSDADCIDAVVLLLDYIESLKSDDNRIEEIQGLIDTLQGKMQYIERLEIMFKDGQYLEFLHLRNWPKTFREYIERRKLELLSRKDSLSEAMQAEIGEIFNQIGSFKQALLEVLSEGLVPANHEKEAQTLAVLRKPRSRFAGRGTDENPSETEGAALNRAVHTPENKWAGAVAFTF